MAKNNGTPSDKPTASNNANQAHTNQANANQPSVEVLAQYIRDLSFESPNAPNALASRKNSPDININIGVNAKQIADTDFETELSITAKAGEDGDNLMFQLEVVYCGLFRILNVPEQNLRPLLFVECPRLLFPFARQIIASTSQQGGFPPLLIDPIDFLHLYQKRLEVEQEHEAKNKST